MNDVSRCSQLAAAQRGSYISACLIRLNTHTRAHTRTIDPSSPLTSNCFSGFTAGRTYVPPVFYTGPTCRQLNKQPGP